MITVIIPTYNRLPYLQKCLAAITNLEFNGLAVEIVIVNDGSIDGTKEYLDSFKDNRIKVLHNEKNLGISQARNTGIKAAKYDLLAFTDDDCIVTSSWLKNLLLVFDDPEVGFAFGPTFYLRNEREKNKQVCFSERTSKYRVNTLYITERHKAYFPEKVVNIKNWPGGGNLAFRRSVFVKCGYFNQYFEQQYHNEDTELAIRAVSLGFKYKYVENAVVNHQPAYWTVKTLLKSAKNASVWPILKKKYPQHYRCFGLPMILGLIVYPQDYLYILLLPILFPVLLVRYIFHGKRDFKIFFTKWPVCLLFRRWYIYREAIKNRVLIL